VNTSGFAAVSDTYRFVLPPSLPIPDTKMPSLGKDRTVDNTEKPDTAAAAAAESVWNRANIIVVVHTAFFLASAMLLT